MLRFNSMIEKENTSQKNLSMDEHICSFNQYNKLNSKFNPTHNDELNDEHDELNDERNDLHNDEQECYEQSNHTMEDPVHSNIQIKIDEKKETMNCVWGLLSCSKTFCELFEHQSIEYDDIFSQKGVQNIITFHNEPEIVESDDRITVRYKVNYDMPYVFVVDLKKDWFDFKFDDNEFKESIPKKKIEMLALRIKQMSEQWPKVVYLEKKDTNPCVITFENKEHTIHEFIQKTRVYNKFIHLFELYTVIPNGSLYKKFNDLSETSYFPITKRDLLCVANPNEKVLTFSRYEIYKDKLLVNIFLENGPDIMESDVFYVCDMVDLVGHFESRNLVMVVSYEDKGYLRLFFKLVVSEKKLCLIVIDRKHFHAPYCQTATYADYSVKELSMTTITSMHINHTRGYGIKVSLTKGNGYFKCMFFNEYLYKKQ